MTQQDPRLAHLHLEVHPVIEMSDLIRAEEVVCICEGEFQDADGERYWVYTVSGMLDGQPIGAIDHVRKCVLGATVGGDAMIIHARDQKEADWIAINGLMDSIDAMKKMDHVGVLDPEANAGTIVGTQVRPKAS